MSASILVIKTPLSNFLYLTLSTIWFTSHICFILINTLSNLRSIFFIKTCWTIFRHYFPSFRISFPLNDNLQYLLLSDKLVRDDARRIFCLQFTFMTLLSTHSITHLFSLQAHKFYSFHEPITITSWVIEYKKFQSLVISIDWVHILSDLFTEQYTIHRFLT